MSPTGKSQKCVLRDILRLNIKPRDFSTVRCKRKDAGLLFDRQDSILNKEGNGACIARGAAAGFSFWRVAADREGEMLIPFKDWLAEQEHKSRR